MVIKSFRALALAAGAVVASPALAQDATFNEANVNQGLVLINAQAANAQGFTGAGVTVGVLDSGIDAAHPDLAPNLADFSFDASVGGPALRDYGMHGTHVAGIIAAARNGVGVQGVAYDARIAMMVPRASGDDEAEADAAIASVYGRALDANVRIFNNSWGFDYYTGTPQGQVMLDAVMRAQTEVFRRAVALDSVIVFSTGNEYQAQPNTQAGLPHYVPELRANWLAVTAVGPAGDIVDYANRCGLAAQWCLAAPGGEIDGGIVSTVPLSQGGYDLSSGTSMAAPHVTGAVAVARQMFPNASGAELARFVLVTATDAGAAGVDGVYGWGLLNMGNMAAARSGLGLELAANAGWAADQGEAVFIHALDARLKAKSAQGAWGAALGGWSGHEATPTSNEAEADSLGLAAGYDTAVGENAVLGAALAWTTTDLDEPGLANAAEIKAVTLAAYGAASRGALFVEGSAGAHRREYDVTRGSLAGAAGTVLEAQGAAARGETDGYGLFADGRIGLSVPAGPTAIRPFLHARASHQAFDGYTETGADVFNLAVEDVEMTRYQAGPGIEVLLLPRPMGAASLSGDLSVRYDAVWGDTDYEVKAAMLGTSISGRVGDLAEPVTVAGGLSAAWGAVEGSLRGFYAQADDSDAQGVSLGLRVTF